MDPENQVVNENPENPAGEAQVQSPEQLAATDELTPQGTPATPAEPAEEADPEFTSIQEAIDREDDPEKRQALEKKRNSYFASRRRQAKEAEEARKEAERQAQEALRQAEYHRGRAEMLQHQPQKAAEPEVPIDVPAHLLPSLPREDDYEDFSQYQIALGEYGAEKRFVEREYRAEVQRLQQEKQRKVQNFQTALQRGQQKYTDFMQTIQNPAVPINTQMWEVISESDTGDEVAYFLGQNPAEALRISQLPERTMIREMGKIEAKLSAPPPLQKTTTVAPEPIRPPQGTAVAVEKKLEDMDMAEFYKRRTQESKRSA